MALNRKIAYIDLTAGEIQIKPIPIELRNKFVGGRGLDAYLLYNHTKQGVDPLGPDNVLLISGGLLTATCASATTRTHVMAKSALTNMLGSTNMGGFFSPELAWAGFHHLVIKGKADKPVYLFIHNGEIEIRDAGNIWGKSVTEAQWAIREELHDPEVKSLVIGPAGENLVRWANVMTGIKNSGGRSGMGCIMGSKNLKAVAVRGTMDVAIAHPVEALEYNKRFIDQITSSKVNQTMGTIGTPFIWGATNSWEASAPAIFNITSATIPTTSSPKGSMRLPLRPWERITWPPASVARFTAGASIGCPRVPTRACIAKARNTLPREPSAQNLIASMRTPC